MHALNKQKLRLACLGLAVMAGIGLGGTSVSAGSTAPASEEKKGAIAERQFIMQRLDEDSETLGNILAGIEPPEKLAEITRAIAKSARDSVDNFRPITPGGRSKDEVWSHHDEFIQQMDRFAQNADAMAKAGQSGNVEAVTRMMGDAMPCKQCHDTYRLPKKPG